MNYFKNVFSVMRNKKRPLVYITGVLLFFAKILLLAEPAIKRTRNQPGESNEPKITEVEENETTRGRPSNGTNSFANLQPLFETYMQRLRSKTAVQVLISPPPTPPSPIPAILTREWINKSRTFSRYIVVLYRPWSAKN